ncbi:hypothetical protein C6P44_000715 [Monosporozyma unispora]|nr:hypothetical protein C6P44_000715 [Kazachstania unispora]
MRQADLTGLTATENVIVRRFSPRPKPTQLIKFIIITSNDITYLQHGASQDVIGYSTLEEYAAFINARFQYSDITSFEKLVEPNERAAEIIREAYTQISEAGIRIEETDACVREARKQLKEAEMESKAVITQVQMEKDLKQFPLNRIQTFNETGLPVEQEIESLDNGTIKFTGKDNQTFETHDNSLKECADSLKELVPVFNNVAKGLENIIERDEANSRLNQDIRSDITDASNQISSAGTELVFASEHVRNVGIHLGDLGPFIRDIGDQIKDVATHLEKEKSIRPTTEAVVTQQNKLLHNIDVIIPKILNTLLEQILSKRDTATEESNETLIKIVIDIYNQYYMHPQTGYPELHSMLQNILDTNNVVKDLVEKNC